MRSPKFSTSRWRRPSTLRRERFAQLLAVKELKETLNDNFIKALENRRDLLEGRQFKFVGWQLPIFLFLAFSLLNLDVNISVLGISTNGAKSLREVLIILSTSLGLISSGITPQLSVIEDMLNAVVLKQGKEDDDLKEFLKVRYGTADVLIWRSFDQDLRPGAPQWIVFGLWTLTGIALVLMLIGILLAVQVLTLIEVYRHPNFSHEAAIFVIVYAVLGDIFGLASWLLRKAVQPYQTDEDLKKLARLRATNDAAYKSVLEDMVKRHYQKDLLRRLFGRPKLRKLP